MRYRRTARAFLLCAAAGMLTATALATKPERPVLYSLGNAAGVTYNTRPWICIRVLTPDGRQVNDVQIQIDDDPNFGSPNYDRTNSAGHQLKFYPLPANSGQIIRHRLDTALGAGTWYVRARVWNNDGVDRVSDWSFPTTAAIWHFDENAGAAAYDASGRNNTATLLAGVSWETGYSGSAVRTDTVSESLTTTPIVVNNQYVLDAWSLFPLVNTGSWRTLFQQQGGNYHHILCDVNGYIGSFNAGWFSTGYDTDVLSAGWHRITAVANGSTTRFYIDGTYVGAAGTVVTYPVSRIGNHDSTQQWGTFDEIRISVGTNGPGAQLVVQAAPSWTDSTITAGSTLIKASHFTELRTAINNTRRFRGYGDYAWTNATLSAGTSLIKVADMNDLRNALTGPHNDATGTNPSFTDTISGGSTLIRKTHIDELRSKTLYP